MADETEKSILLGNRSVSVLDAQGNPVSGEEAARVALPGLQQVQDARAAAGPGLLRSASNAFNTVLGDVAGTVGYGADRVVNPILRSVGFQPTPFTSADEARAKAKELLPTTPSGVAALVAGGPVVGKLGALKGILAGAGGGAALEGISSGDPGAGAVTGALGTAVPAAVGGAVRAIATGVQKLATKAGIRAAVTEPQAARMLAGMKEDAPALYKAISAQPGSSPAKLSQIHDPDVWDASMGALMRRAEAPIIKAIPEIPSPAAAPVAQYVDTPAMAAVRRGLGLRPGEVPPGGWGMYGIALPTPQTVMMPMETALSTLKNMKADAAKAFDPAHPALGRELRQAAADWEEQILRAVNAKSPEMAKRWADAMDQYNKAVRYRELGKAALTAAEPEAAGTPFDTAGLLRHYWDNAGHYHPSVLPGFNRHFFAGEPGAQPVAADPGLYARMFAPGPAHVKANIPTPHTVTVPGQQYGAPRLTEILANAARTGVINLSETANSRR